MISGPAPQAGPRAGDEDPIALATLTFPGAGYATLEWGSVHRRPEHHIIVQGTRGHLGPRRGRPFPLSDQVGSAQLDDHVSLIEPLVAGTRRRSRHLDLSLPLRMRVFR